MDPGVPVLTMVILRDEPVGNENTSTGNQRPDLVLVDDRTCTGPGDGEPLDTFVIHAREFPELPASVRHCGLLFVADLQGGTAGDDPKGSCNVCVRRTAHF
ncbi:hypothetical protein W823_17530 [Williamsia sp. D3]|nr:hypothetical protein W823_17530 [Williamsia sp. D3]